MEVLVGETPSLGAETLSSHDRERAPHALDLLFRAARRRESGRPGLDQQSQLEQVPQELEARLRLELPGKQIRVEQAPLSPPPRSMSVAGAVRLSRFAGIV